MNAERQRLEEARQSQQPWRRWGPYLSERQWGTVREDYSSDGTAWDYFSHDMARSRAYRWGEDGIAGLCDDQQRLCLALAMWNGRDPILKERLFGLTNSEGNHGEDVKEQYYYLDATPTNSYLKMLYKYPQREFPYARLVDENRRRGKLDMEFELLDTGVFDDDRYWDVLVEYAKAAPDDLFWQITVHNRGPEAAVLHLLPQIWFRNRWSWSGTATRPSLAAIPQGAIAASHHTLGDYVLYCQGAPELLFCENETNGQRLWGLNGAGGYFKDAFHDYVIHGRRDAVNPRQIGTKAAAHYVLQVPAGGQSSVRLRLVAAAADPPTPQNDPLDSFDRVVQERQQDADEFYADLQSDIAEEDARRVHRQALAGMIWSKQFYHYDVPRWLDGDPTQPQPPHSRRHGRNSRMAARQQRRRHLDARQVGVSLVRGVGPGVPLRGVSDGRRGIRQGPARAADARVVHAPQRRAAGLRVGLGRRQPAGARLGRLARVSDRPPHAGATRATSRFSSAYFTS